jgi:uncharacterized protein YoaH (UPF0181 family)
MAELALDSNEFCPSCGEWVETLDQVSGWCSECSFVHHPDTISRQKLEIFLCTHADRIEILMHEGLSLTSAIRVIRNDIRPNCVVCDEPIKGGKQYALFCGPHRRSYYHKLRRLKKKGMSHTEALKKVLNADTNPK